MTSPRVSIVMPVFNAAGSIAAAIASAQAQGEGRLEMLVVDDASTDATAAIVDEAAALDPRIRLLRMGRNGGPAAARNRGIAEARGDWVALLDADDRFDARRLETLLTLGEQCCADMVSDNILLCGGAACDARTPMIPPELLGSPRLLTAAEFVERNIGSRKYPRVSFGFMKPMFRRAFLDAHALRYDERNRFGEDFLLYVQCLVRGAAWWITPEPMYLYAVRAGSLTEVQTAGDLGRIRAMDQALLDDPGVAADAALARALRRHKAGIARRYHYRGFTDALKAKQAAAAATLLFGSVESLHGIAREGLAQAPVIVGKAWRGGYRRGRRDASVSR